MSAPSGRKSRWVSGSSLSRSTCGAVPLATSTSESVELCEQKASVAPSAEKATLRTQPADSTS